MSRGRPPLGPEIVYNLDGSESAKNRMKIVLETLSGDLTVEEACEKLGIGKTAFHELRQKVLQDAVTSLEPKRVGRPAKQKEEDTELGRLRRENFELKRDIRAAQLREEIGLKWPHLRKRYEAEQAAKKKAMMDQQSREKPPLKNPPPSGDGSKSTSSGSPTS